MDFTEKTVDFFEKSKSLIKDYDNLYQKAMQFASEMENLFEPTDFDSTQQFEEWVSGFRKVTSSNERIVKIARLLIALRYVEMPNDKQIVSDLEENIQLNQISSANKK